MKPDFLPGAAARAISDARPPSNDASAGPSHWSEFWQEFAPKGQIQERCHIPGDGRVIVDRHWAWFAASLTQRAEVLDIGCGAGVVGRAMLKERGDLLVTGIDFANVPIPRVPNLTVHPWVSMETLPFGEACFDAAISLFGIEYGDIARTAGELARVLKRGGRFSFLVHHGDSETVHEGSYRRAAMRMLLSQKIKTAFLAGNVTSLDQQLNRLADQFPGERSVTLFAKLLRGDVVRIRAHRQAAWQNLTNGLGTEIALLAQLERSAKSPVEMGSWLAELLGRMAKVEVSVLRRASGQPIAWEVSGVR